MNLRLMQIPETFWNGKKNEDKNFYRTVNVTFHIHANHPANWRRTNTVLGPKGLPLAEGDFKRAVPVTIHDQIIAKAL